MQLTESTILSAACLAPWGDAAEGLPGAAPQALDKVPGFAFSRFAPLVNKVVRDCLDHVDSTVHGAIDRHTPIILTTQYGDATTVDGPMLRAVEGKRPKALWFFQSATTSVLSHLTRHYALDGPLTCISAIDDPAGEAVRMAELLLRVGESEHVLIIGVELAPNERVASATTRVRALGQVDIRSPEGDAAAALLLRRCHQTQLLTAVTEDRPSEVPINPAHFWKLGWLSPLFELCITHSSPTG